MELNEILEQLDELPKETLVYKTIKGKKQPYLQWTEGGKSKTRYIKLAEREELLPMLDRKAELKKALKSKLDELSSGYEGVYYVSDVERPYYVHAKLDNEQLISKKEEQNAFTVERNYINSKSFHDKFIALPASHVLQECIYKQVGRLLDFVDGKDEERMIAISSRTGQFIVDNFDRPGYLNHTSFTEEEYQIVNNSMDGIVLIHNHTLNGRPSARDIISYATGDKVSLSIIACHNGTIYCIYDAKRKVVDVFERLLEKEKDRFNDSQNALIFATNKLYFINDKLGERQKLFYYKEI